MHQEVYDTGNVSHALRRVVRTIADVRRRTGDRVLVSTGDKLVTHTRLQFLFNLKFSSALERSLYEVILNHAMAAERLGPGAFDMCIERLLEKLTVQQGVGTGDDLSKKIRGILGAGATPAAKEDIDRIVDTYAGTAPSRVMPMLRQALDLAGFAGRILIEKTHARTTSVELVRGYTFEQSAAFPVSVKLEHPRIFCIDGYVESVSELHHLFEAAAEAKEPAVMFVRGLHDEVKHTLKVNFDRGSLKVVPIIVRFDLEGINTLNDISIATGADLVTSNKGDLITSIKFHEAPRVDEVIIHRSQVVIKNEASRFAVASHVASLRHRRHEQSIEDVGTLLDKRIKALSPNHVIIRLTDDRDFVASSQAVDYVLRAIKALIDHGTVIVNDERVLTATAVASEIHADRCLRTLISLGTVLSPVP